MLRSGKFGFEISTPLIISLVNFDPSNNISNKLVAQFVAHLLFFINFFMNKLIIQVKNPYIC
jgi:hypothetical protein